MAITLEELKKMYAEKGGTTQRITQSGEAGDVIDYLTNDLGEGFSAIEDQPIIGYEGQGMDATPIYGDKVLSGFTQAKDGMDYFYDPEGVFQGSRKSQKADTFWDTFGPIIIGAMTMGGGSAALGGYLFPSLSATAAAGAGGALVGGANAAFTDQNILKGALKGGVGSAGSMELGNTGFTLGDATKAINFAQNPTLAGAANLASPYLDTNFNIGDTGFTTNDLLKGANTVQALGSGDNQQIFNAITGLAKDQGGNLNSFAGFNTNPNDFTKGYFLPGGEGYIDPMSKTEGVTGSGYYDEITGRYIKDDLGGLTNPLGREIGNLDPNSKWEYSLTRPGVWANDKGEEIDLSYLPNTEKVMTGREIMEKAGALPKATDKTKTAAKTTPNKLDLNALGSAFGGTGIPSEDSLADIKLMQQIFGQDIDYKLASVGGSKRK
jgi:hypothetical protein